MKLKFAVWAVLIAVTCTNAFGQGYANAIGTSGSVWDEFKTAGVGVRASNDVEVAFLWNTNNAPGSLPSIGTAGNFSQKANLSIQETATNHVTDAFGGLFALQNLLANGWQWASNGLSFVSVQVNNVGGFNYNLGTSFPLDGTTAGGTYEFIAVGWNASAGATGVLSGNESDLGWSNPFSYLTGTSAADANGFVQFSTAGGMNQFGVASVIPEPTTFALAGLGAMLLAFRRRK